jgi:hypothetical protein
MKQAYQFMLLLYPRGYRDQFAGEMTRVFEESFAERREHRWTWSVRFAFAEMAGLIGGAAQAWIDHSSAPEIPAASCSPNDLMEAQQRVDLNIAGMVHAIANHQFERARVFSDQERRAREQLRVLREKYGIGG